MANKLNAEQQQFVSTLNTDVLVSASAGSGKTTTMIEKLKSLIINDLVPVNNLLVVTFTEAAASEMKQKLYVGLAQAIANSNFDEEKLNYFYEQLFLISSADIGTLHSVCKKIVSKYFYEVNIEPNFGILTNEEYLNLFNQAMEKTFNNYIESADEEFYEVYESFSDKRNTTKLKNIITSIYNFLSEKSDSKTYVNFVLNKCLNKDENSNICCKYVFDYYKPSVQKFFQTVCDFENIISDEKLQNYLKQLKAEIKFVVGAENYSEFATRLNNLSFPRLYAPKDATLLNIFEELKFCVDDFKKFVTKAKVNCINLTESEFEITTNKLKKLYSKLFEITLKTEEEFTNLKNEIGKLDFSDLQKYAYKILCNSAINDEVKKSYKYVFVDEYQDINQIQEDILLKISNNNLNMIGDVKQSIYAFRQCMPEIFLSKYNKFLKQKNNQLILLNKNYRCSKSVVDFVNYCFNTLITKDTIGINYEKESQLILGSENSGEVCLKLIDTQVLESENSEQPAPMQSEDDDDKIENEIAEALEVTNIICDVLNKEYYNSALKQTCKINYSDIAVLVRDNKGFVNTLYDVLKAHQIPVSAQIKTTLFNTIEIKPLFSLLKLLNNVNSDLDVCNVLLSPLVNLSYDELNELRQTNKTVGFYDCVTEYLSSDKNTPLFDKLNKFVNLLNTLKYRMNYSSIMELVSWVVIKFDLINYYSSFPNGAQMAENIKQFVFLLNNAGFNFNLNKCLEFLDSLKGKDDFVINVESGENSVKILTMHKSKGLEYPCVILSNLGKSFNKSTYASDVILTNKLGLGINLRNSETRNEVATIQKSANKLYALNEQLEEQIRLMYVALTRARNFLFLTGCYNFKNFASRTKQNIFSSTNFLDLIFKCIKNGDRQGFINLKPNFNLTHKNEVVANVEIKNISQISNATKNVKNKIIISENSNNIVNTLVKNFELTKPVSSKKLATKNSVTGLMREDDYVNENELSLQVDFNGSVLDNMSLKIGNAYHKIMQNLTYVESDEEVKQKVASIIKTYQIEPEVALHIDVNKIIKAKNEVKKLIGASTKIFKEQQFLLKTPYSNVVETSNINQNILIQGVVDLILVDNGSAILIDFKTNKTKDVSKLINAYSLQLEVYKQAVEKGMKVKVVSTKLYLFEMGSFLEIV